MEFERKLLLNEKEAALLLSMSTHFLRRDRISQCSVGIPFVRIGAAIRYRVADLELWIAGRMLQPTPALTLSPPVSAETEVKRSRGRPRKQSPGRS
jgi:hypothetical protein